MPKQIPKILVTGGAGFIGSEFVRQAVRDFKIIVSDKLTYAGDLARLVPLRGRYKFYKADICDRPKLEKIFEIEKPQFIVNFAAETHVDRSIFDSRDFLATNITGTQVLLDLSRRYNLNKFIQISTDEVYGDIEAGSFSEHSPLKPNSPYAASKAAADLLINSYIRTYQIPAVIVRPSNNYGPWQYPEKFIPVVIYKALQRQRVPLYANGLNVREWFFVSDCARAILLILKDGKTGEIYNIGSGREYRNIDLAKKILRKLKRPASLIEFVKDRPGHDFRYSLDCSKVRKLGWSPAVEPEQGINLTLQWYKANREWLKDKVWHLKSYWEKVYRAV